MLHDDYLVAKLCPLEVSVPHPLLHDDYLVAKLCPLVFCDLEVSAPHPLLHDDYLVAKLCPTLATPWTVALQAPLCMGFPRQEYWSGLPFPFPGDLPNPGFKPVSCIAGRFFTAEQPWEGFVI